MAAPHVAGVAALLYSQGIRNPPRLKPPSSALPVTSATREGRLVRLRIDRREGHAPRIGGGAMMKTVVFVLVFVVTSATTASAQQVQVKATAPRSEPSRPPRAQP